MSSDPLSALIFSLMQLLTSFKAFTFIYSYSLQQSYSEQSKALLLHLVFPLGQVFHNAHNLMALKALFTDQNYILSRLTLSLLLSVFRGIFSLLSEPWYPFC